LAKLANLAPLLKSVLGFFSCGDFVKLGARFANFAELVFLLNLIVLSHFSFLIKKKYNNKKHPYTPTPHRCVNR